MAKFECDMSRQLAVFDDSANITFEDFANSDDQVFWFASDLAMMLGYNKLAPVGLYNMNLNKLKNYKGMGDLKGSMLDFMNPVELAANTFRITQTEEKIRNQNIHGQKPLERAAEEVGRTVRNVMIQTSGTRPEDLKLSDEKINKVRTGIKQTKRALEKIDKDKK